MYRFLVVIEKVGDHYSAYSPDLPGCIAAGDTQKEAEENMHQAIKMHIEGLEAEHLPIPKSEAISEYVAV